jgi:hypothetical protein
MQHVCLDGQSRKFLKPLARARERVPDRAGEGVVDFAFEFDLIRLHSLRALLSSRHHTLTPALLPHAGEGFCCYSATA